MSSVTIQLPTTEDRARPELLELGPVTRRPLAGAGPKPGSTSG
jgi:hypothetical protein